MTKYEKLSQLVEAPFSASGVRGNSHLQQSLIDILNTGSTRTGDYSGRGRYTKAVVWTSEVSNYLTKLGIAHECGNDAPKGGASGEYVKVTSPSFCKVTRKLVAEEKARIAREKAEYEESFNRHREEVRQAYAIKGKFERQYNTEIFTRINNSLHGDARKRNRKAARKTTARIIAEQYGLTAYGVDFVMCQPTGIIENFIK